MAMINDPDVQAWFDEAALADVVEVAQRVLHINLKRVGRDLHASCPVCGGKDGNEFILTPGNATNKRFLCRKSGIGGDAIRMVRHVSECSRIEAAESILGRPMPKSGKMSEPRPIDHEAEKARAEAMKEDRASAQRKDARTRSGKASRAQEVWDTAKPLYGTHAYNYLKERGCEPLTGMLDHLRFLPSHPFTDGIDDNGEAVVIGRWPVMVAAIRALDGTITGLHCTYLDRNEPRKAKIEFEREGRAVALNPKRMYGTKGLIHLGEIGKSIVVAEGIETVIGWCRGPWASSDFVPVVAGDLGHLAGSATGTVKHPVLQGRTIPNGIPREDAPGMLAFIPLQVDEAIVLGDADEHPQNVIAHLLMAARRMKQRGITPLIHMSPRLPNEMKSDWADVARFEKNGGVIS